MMYKSNTGGGEVVDFENAILNGFAEDGGLYVPEFIPQVSRSTLSSWKKLSYVELAFEILSLYIEDSIIPATDLKNIIQNAYADFESTDVIPIQKLNEKSNLFILELFRGPTLSFKDIGIAFLVNVFQYFLEKRNEFKNIVVATTGDTGPAAAYYCSKMDNMNIWVLYPKGMITLEQEQQITSLSSSNVFPIGVENCPDGGDDLDLVIANLFKDETFKQKHKISSVNSINWGRIVMQTVHYFYAYLQVADDVEEIDVAVPSGAFGNLCAGSIARWMGLPIRNYIVANGENACLHRIFSSGLMSKEEIIETPSSAIDILIPYNFWRFLYFATGKDSALIARWKKKFDQEGKLSFDLKTQKKISEGFKSISISAQETLDTIKNIFIKTNYLLDPHSAVAIKAAFKIGAKNTKIVCLATAHPAKFPSIITKSLGMKSLPAKAKHSSMEEAKLAMHKNYTCQLREFETELRKLIAIHSFNS